MSIAPKPRNDQTVDVALATYNGSTYIGALLDSLQAQSHRPLNVRLSDDASADNTLEIATTPRSDLPVKLVGDGGKRGVARNFETALAHCTAPYVALCDQDDIWHPDKVTHLLGRMRELEIEHGPNCPLLVFCDLRLVDAKLEHVYGSFFSTTLKSSDGRTFSHFLIGNHVPGCSMMVNRRLLDLALPFPDVYIHDWWLILVCSIFGQVSYLDEALIDYRQHGNNTIGLGVGEGGAAAKIAGIFSAPAATLARRCAQWQRDVVAIRKNLAGLLDRFGNVLPPDYFNTATLLLEGGGRLRTIWIISARLTGERLVDRVALWWLLGRR